MSNTIEKERQELLEELRTEQKKLADAEREARDIENYRPSFGKRVLHIFAIRHDKKQSGIHRWGVKDKVKSYRKSIKRIKQNIRDIDELKNEVEKISGFAAVMDRLQSSLHNLIGLISGKESDDPLSWIILALEADVGMRVTVEIGVLLEKAQELKPRYLREAATWDALRINTEIRKHQRNLKEVASLVDTHQEDIGKGELQLMLNPLKDHRRALQNLIYELEEIGKRNQKPKVSEDVVQRAIKEVIRQVETQIGMKVGKAELQEKYPQYQDLIEREFRKIEYRLKG
jgi:hypothetical protein